jgi:hypothetical protein
MSEPKTKPNKSNVLEFLNSIEPDQRRLDGLDLLKMFEEITGEKAIMWGTSIVGFGMYHYKSDKSKQEGDWPLVAFSPRKQNLTLYIMTGNENSHALFNKLGEYKTSKACLYINKLSDIDKKVLRALIVRSFVYTKRNF